MNTVIKVVINGAFGKMGALALETLQKSPDFEVVAALGKNDSLREVLLIQKPDILLDLTRADVLPGIMEIILETKVQAVIGTSGLSKEAILGYAARANAQKQGIILAANFSLGVALMMKYAKDAARYFNESEIIEMHHAQKQDAPSGTALKTARMMQEGDTEARTIPIHSVRISGKMAHQQVIFGSLGETLTIAHDAIDRACFMPGLLRACRAVNTLNHFEEGLEFLL